MIGRGEVSGATADLIKVVEPTFRDEQHAPANAGIIRAILRSGQARRVEFHATLAHWSAVRQSLPSEDLALVDAVPIRVDKSGRVRPSRALRQFRNLLACSRGADRPLVVLSSSPETFFASRLVCSLRPKLRMLIVLHGNLVEAVGWRSRDPRRRLVDYAAGLRVSRHPGIRLMVLEGAIRSAMAEAGIPDWDRTLVLPHPASEAEFRGEEGLANKPGLTLGFIGHAKHAKGFGGFLALAKWARSRPDVSHRFVLAGFLADAFPPEELAGIDCSSAPLSRGAFLQAVSEIDYACLPYPAAFYSLTASGSLLDAACALKPVIALSYPGLREITREFGPIGFLCSSEDEMRALLADPLRIADPQAYVGFQRNLKRLRESRLPAALGHRLSEFLDAKTPLQPVDIDASAAALSAGGKRTRDTVRAALARRYAKPPVSNQGGRLARS